MIVSPSRFESSRAPVTRLVVSFIAALSLLFGPLAFAPAQAATATISGTVTGEIDGALEDVTVTLEVYNASVDDFEDPIETETTDAGAYSFTNVTTASKYRVSVQEIDSFVLADPVEFVLSGAKVVSFALVKAGSISGLVKDGLAPIDGATVTIYPVNGSTVDLGRAVEEETDTDGTFVVGGLRAGGYKVKIEDYKGNHLAKFYNDNATVVVNKSEDTRLGDITLVTGSTFSGSIKAESGELIDGAVASALPVINGVADYDLAVDAEVDGTGAYVIGGLSAGRYKVMFTANDEAYVDEFYNDQPTEEAANVLVLAAGASQALAPTTLEKPAAIKGTVKNSSKKKLESIYVEAYQVRGGIVDKVVTDEVETDGSGEFLLEALRGGSTYRLKFVDDEGRYQTRFSSDVKIAGGAVTSVGVIVMANVPKKAASIKVSGKGGKKKATLTITVKASGVTPTGKVKILLGSKTLKTVTLKKGKATVTLTKQKKGNRVYKVIYSGDSKVLAKSVTTSKIKIK